MEHLEQEGKKNESPCCVWDLTLSKTENDHSVIIKAFGIIAKKWVFQEEKGEETGFEHYQCRISLKVKKRKNELKKMLFDNTLIVGGKGVSQTSNANMDNSFYVLKTETRVAGPWSNEDKALPWDLKDLILRPWQQQVVDSAQLQERRTINVILNKEGNAGKSIVAKWIDYYDIGHYIPPQNNFKDMMQFIASFPIRNLYVIDIPRACNQRDLGSMYAAVENLKSGMIFDTRHKGVKMTFGSPVVWVFCNEKPNLEYLSADRWKFWKITEEFNLEIIQ